MSGISLISVPYLTAVTDSLQPLATSLYYQVQWCSTSYHPDNQIDKDSLLGHWMGRTLWFDPLFSPNFQYEILPEQHHVFVLTLESVAKGIKATTRIY